MTNDETSRLICSTKEAFQSKAEAMSRAAHISKRKAGHSAVLAYRREVCNKFHVKNTRHARWVRGR